MPKLYFVGVDVGTGSVRAALVQSNGTILATAVHDIETWNPTTDHYEQSSANIWYAVCECVKNVIKNVDKHFIAGIGFDATCSLVAIDRNNQPLTISTTGNNEQNVILWLDHRATQEADIVNATKHDLLKYVGGKVSPEMQCPKMLWLKKHLPITCWSKIGKLFDLPDFLTWKCTGDDTRSLCSVVCKWNYDSENNCWSTEFLNKINLSELHEQNFQIIGNKILNPGVAIGQGLTDEAAKDLNLLPKTSVGVSMIDAHAGALCLYGCKTNEINDNIITKLAIISGTSSCHMSVTEEPILSFGIWGPYKNAIFPNMYLNEAGQSATGVLLEHMLKVHPAYESIKLKCSDGNIHKYLNNFLNEMCLKCGLDNLQKLTNDIHVWPDYHGNRSPIADPNLKGMISGLTMSTEEEDLALKYLATIQALAYGTKHILDTLKNDGRPDFKSILICGGLSKNLIYVQTHADVCEIPVYLPKQVESVLVGASILGAVSAQVFNNLQSASLAMGGEADVVQPNSDNYLFHKRKYKVFRKMYDDQISYKNLMKDDN